MSKEKPSQVAVDNLVNQLSYLKQNQRNIQSFVRLKDYPEWAPFKALLEDLAKMHDKAVTSHVEFGDHMDDRERCRSIDIQRQQRDDFKFVIQIAERPQTELERLEKTIFQVEEDLKDKRAELAEFGLDKTE